MSTVVKNQLATQPEASHRYSSNKPLKNSEPPRFDLIIKNLQIENNAKKFRGMS